MRKLLLCVIICLISANIKAQKCKDFSALYGTVIKEFPQASFDKPTKERLLFDRIAYNLISDKYFLNISKKSFTELSKKDLEKLKKKLFKCTNVDGCWQLRDYLYQFFLFSNLEAAKNHVREISSQRIQLKETLSQLNNGASFNGLIQQEASVNDNFGLLTTLEVQGVLDLINSKKGAAADNDLLLKKNHIGNLPETFKSLAELNNFKYENRQLYQHASSSVQTELNAMIENKREKILQTLSAAEKNKLENISFNIRDIAQVNGVFDNLKASYSQYENYNSVESLYAVYRKKKADLISNNAYEIAKKAEGFYTIKELENLSKTYIANTSSTLNIEKLKEYIASRKEAIEKYLREKEEERQRIALRKENKFKENKKLISSLREEAEKLYNTKIPTFEELHYILQEYLDLINEDNKKYSESEASQFIRVVEKMEYWREDDDNISTLERFKDRNGFSIIASALTIKKTNSDVEFRMPNAPKEIIALFQLELVTEFRNAWKTAKDPFESPKPYNRYVNSGRTMYSYFVKDDGTLIARAEYNSDAGGTILAEREDSNTLQVSSFSNMTDVKIEKGQTINFQASGTIRVGILTTKPDGIDGWRSFNIVPSFRHGMLMGKIGEDGKWFQIGRRKTIKAQESGFLYLRMNERDVSNNSGHFTVRYTLE